VVPSDLSTRELCTHLPICLIHNMNGID
jgi:hypothetical protein